jgi:hypothetical protein
MSLVSPSGSVERVAAIPRAEESHGVGSMRLFAIVVSHISVCFNKKPRRGTMSGQSWLLRSKERTWTVVTRYRRVAPPVTDITKLSFQRFHQPPNGQGSRPHCALVSAHPRRRGDQITRRYPLALDCRGYWCGLRREGQRWADIFISAADA